METVANHSLVLGGRRVGDKYRSPWGRRGHGATFGVSLWAPGGSGGDTNFLNTLVSQWVLQCEWITPTLQEWLEPIEIMHSDDFMRGYCQYTD